MEKRYIPMHHIEFREQNEKNFLEGYFAVFNSEYVLWKGATESIAPGAFSDCLKDDVRALYNHNTDLILGRTTAGTMEISQDEKGLWGRIEINERDTDALNVYERIKRHDITGCSFGFSIEKESVEERPDGSVHWTIEKIGRLYEISPCTFPAYEETSVESRKNDFARIQERKIEIWKNQTKEKLKNIMSQ